jgi:hypothetical protein
VIQSYVRPYKTDAHNNLEIAAQMMLLIQSIVLASNQPPFDDKPEVGAIMFLLVSGPTIVFLIAVALVLRNQRIASQSVVDSMNKQKQLETNGNTAASTNGQHPAKDGSTAEQKQDNQVVQLSGVVITTAPLVVNQSGSSSPTNNVKGQQQALTVTATNNNNSNNNGAANVAGNQSQATNSNMQYQDSILSPVVTQSSTVVTQPVNNSPGQNQTQAATIVATSSQQQVTVEAVSAAVDVKVDSVMVNVNVEQKQETKEGQSVVSPSVVSNSTASTTATQVEGSIEPGSAEGQPSGNATPQ